MHKAIIDDIGDIFMLYSEGIIRKQTADVCQFSTATRFPISEE